MLAIDTETTGLFIHKGCRAFMVTAVCDQNKSYLWYFPVNPKTRTVNYNKALLNDLKDTIAQHNILIFHNANFDLQVLNAMGIPYESLFENHTIEDTMVMSHAYYSKGPHGLKELGVTLLEFPEDDERALSTATQAARKIAAQLGWRIADKDNLHPSLLGQEKDLYKTDYWVPEQVAAHLNYPHAHPWRTICRDYAINDVIRTMGIYQVLLEGMTLKQRMSYFEARKLILPILRMQYEQIPVLESEIDKTLSHYQLKLTKHIRTLERMAQVHGFNPKSPIQLKNVLFQKFKFEPKIFSDKTGEPATNKDQIKKLLEDCPVLPYPQLEPKYKFLIELNKYRKTKTTIQYAKNYHNHTVNGYIQPFYKQTATGTNRLSCENPNATNVGKQDMSNPFAAVDHFNFSGDEEDSFKLRNLFGPKDGNKWIAIDYSQFQLRIFATVSESHDLVESFAQGRDIHNTVACTIFRKDNISDIERTAAKAINFGLLFGAGPAKIEKLAGMPGLYNQFLTAFPNAKKFLDLQSQQAQRKGYVFTVGGYRLYVPFERSYAASCYVIQGTEAEIVRRAMVDISHYTYSNDTYMKMMMMVHDELDFITPFILHSELNTIMDLMVKASTRLGIPASVDASIITHNWSIKHDYIGPCECHDIHTDDYGVLVKAKVNKDKIICCLNPHCSHNPTLSLTLST
jgi:DNA polymerase I-like protein with 3'-5' exonuclease and polymerase domains